MNPAFSVIFLTTLIGVGQGLFIALYAAHLLALLGLVTPADSHQFQTMGSLLSLAFLGLGLFASFFHLGHPERAWRAATMWRTSWLSREVIVLPFFMLAVCAYGAAHLLGSVTSATLLGGIALILCVTLFICTGMIYGCIKFLQEWATPLTIVNYTLFGCASGFTLATAFSLPTAPALVPVFGVTAIVLTLMSLLTRLASLARNARLKPRSTLQTATGIRHPHIVQKAQGSMGGSFNTRHYFHGKSRLFFRSVKWIFLVLVFPLPLLLLGNGLLHASLLLLATAFVVQYAGLIAERWFFFAQANHPQNLYYQQIS